MIRIRPLTEVVIDSIIVDAACGRRAHPDQDRRTKHGADYILGRSVIELKILDDEGLSKKERQEKLASLFLPLDPTRPVIVLDREQLDEQGRRAYDKAFENTFKSLIASAKKQLRQSRSEHPNTERSILMIINNANTALDHDEIVALAGRRVRNDTREIDGVVVAGTYLHSDDFESVSLWPMTYVPGRLDQAFPEYEMLHKAFQGYAQKIMTDAIMNLPGPHATKGAVLDTYFDLDGRRFVKPAPPFGNLSKFYINGRPRANTIAIERCLPVAVIYPELERLGWSKLRALAPWEAELGVTYEDWLRRRDRALSTATSLKPVLTIPVTLEGWLEWMINDVPVDAVGSLGEYANYLFDIRVKSILGMARDADQVVVRPSKYIAVLTELIGQDEANDVSHLTLVHERAGRESQTQILVENARIFHLHAVALAASYAVKYEIDHVFWRKDLRYAWC